LQFVAIATANMKSIATKTIASGQGLVGSDRLTR
jgi:hypothetical protein